MFAHIEVTDTFSGEPNYSWVNRQAFKLSHKQSDLSIVRQAKRAIGWNSVRCQTMKYGDMVEIRPYGVCMVAFITFKDSGE